MIGLELLLGHLVGDYILQNDYMARNKTAWGKDVRRAWRDVDYVERDGVRYPRGTTVYHNAMVDEHVTSVSTTWRGHVACTVHCLCYTLAVWAFTFAWVPWWGLLACFLAHWPIDRFRLATKWMTHVSGQAFFASPQHPMFPWSIVMVDNIAHLLTLYAIARLAGVG